MRSDDVTALRQIRRARVQSAEVALRRAQAAQHGAAAARLRAEQAAADFAAARGAQEAAIQRSLCAGPVPAHHLRQAAAQLSGIAAHAAVLQQRAQQATTQEAACDHAAGTARRAHAVAARAALAVDLLTRRLDAAARKAAEQDLEAELDAVAARKSSPSPCGRGVGGGVEAPQPEARRTRAFR
ncbi:MAG TPA: YscO family type III secretion system apparatus protein [Acetobacteraceae bacterium]|jgi:Type III secretion protein YscO|nr:YscO family type III secretion system apparatus protein [Acetobacteraceae bacterium]